MIHVLSNEKDINTKSYYIGLQISKVISESYSKFSMNIDENLLNSLIKLKKILKLTPVSLYPVFSNNLLRTDFNKLSIFVLKRYLSNGKKTDVLIEIFKSVLYLSCDCIRCCENFGRYLMNPDYEALLTKVILNITYKDNKFIIQSCISILYNIIRRENNAMFDQNLIPKLLEIYHSEDSTKEFKIIACSVVFYLASDENIKQYYPLAHEVKYDIIEVIEKFSTNESFYIEEFSLNELLEVLKIFCKDYSMKDFVSANKSLFSSLILILGRDNFVNNIVRFVKYIYGQQKFEDFQHAFFAKYGRSNEKIVKLLET